MMISAGVQIGFDRTMYTASESDELVILNFGVISGVLSRDVVVQLVTRERTAEGNLDINY